MRCSIRNQNGKSVPGIATSAAVYAALSRKAAASRTPPETRLGALQNICCRGPNASNAGKIQSAVGVYTPQANQYHRIR